jgi:cytochrome c oxidase subunit 3
MRTLDVSHLPNYGFGTRTPIWWGNTVMLLIETTMFGICLVTYFYLRQIARQWPPRTMDVPELGPTVANLVVLAVGSAFMYAAGQAVETRSLRLMRWLLAAVVAAGLVSLGVRAVELDVVHFKWSTHAYGSIFWTTMGLHTLHLLTATLESVALVYQLYRGPVYMKHLHDLRLAAVYWHWMVLILVPIDFVLYVVPRLH